MPIEIRELVIKTEVQTRPQALDTQEFKGLIGSLKQQVLRECFRRFERNGAAVGGKRKR